MRSDQRGFAHPGYIAALIILLVALGFVAYGNFTHAISFQYVGYVILALSFGIGMAGGGVRNPYVLGILPSVLAVVLILVNVLNVGGLKAYGL